MTADPSQLLVSAEALSLAIGDPTAQQRLQQALEDATALLSGLSARVDYDGLLQQAFGSAGTAADQFSANLQALAELLQASGLQITVELRSDAEMGGALGAYAAVSPAGGERIYLNADWISSGVGVEAMVRVLLEESGHAIDQRLNSGADAVGDEGQLFSALLLGTALSQEQLAAIAAEDDHTTLLLDGQQVQVEVAATALSSTTLGATGTTQAINRATASSITVTVTYDHVNNNGADILVAAFNGTTLIGWTIFNRSSNLDAGNPGPATATIDVVFDLAQFNTDISSGGLTLKAWQGTTTGTGNNDFSVKPSGTSSQVAFGISDNSSSTTTLSSALAGGGSATWSNTTVDVTVPATTVTIASISDDSGVSSSDFITNDNNGLTIGASLSAALAAGEKLQYSNNNGSNWIDVSGTDISGTSVSRLDSSLTSTSTIQFRVVDAVGNAGTAASQLITIDSTAPATPVITTAATTTDTSPVISGTSEAGSSVSLTIAGATYTTTATGGVWSIDIGTATPSSGSLGSISANNSYTVSVTATDAAGNSGTASQTLSVVEPILKTVTINSLSVDSGLLSTDFITNDSNGLTITATLSAALGAGESLQYSNNNGTSWTDVTGSVTGTAVSVLDASLTATATIQFRIANTTTGAIGEAASKLVTIDTTAPTIPASDLKNTLSLDASSTALQPVVALGWLGNNSAQAPTLTAGDVIEIFDNATNAVLGRHLITAGNLTGGKWDANTATVALTGIGGDGTYNLKVRIADVAGNVAAASVSTATFALVIDTTAPATPILTLGTGVADGASTTEATQVSGVITVTAEFSSSVAVTFTNGVNSVTKSVSIPPNGTNTIGVTLTTADLVSLGDGIINVSATATDAAGNTSTAGTTSFLLNPSITVNAVVVDPDNLPGAGAEIATFTSNIDLGTVDVVPVDSTLFTVDEAAGKVYLTQAGAEKLAADQGLFTVGLKLVASSNTALAYDQETDYLGGLQTVTPSVDIGSGFPAYLSFAEFWKGTASDKDGDPLSAANPNQFNYFKATSQITGAGGWFVADPSGTNNVGNNTYGTLHYRNGSGALITIAGTLSRVYKENGNDIQTVYFYPGTDFPTPTAPGASLDLYMLDLYGSTRPDRNNFTITAGTVYKTSSDSIDELFYPVTVNSVTVNEASPWAVFTITGVEFLELSLDLGNTSDPSDKDATPAGFSRQYSCDGGATWIDYTWDGSTGNRPTIPAGGTVLVRVDITSESDPEFESAETFTLVVTPQGGGEVAGIGTIFDDGTGNILAVDASGNPLIDGSGNPILDEDTTKDDDRPITVTGGNFNEGSSRAIFIVEANPDQLITLDVRDVADPSGSVPPTGDNEGEDEGDSLDAADIYYSIDGGNTWVLYDGTPFAAGDQPILVSVDITNESDDVYEGEEQFQLVVNSGISTEKSAYASIFDDGTGDLLELDASGNPKFDASGNPILDDETTKDDDRTLTVSGELYNEGSTHIFWTINGTAAQVVGLNSLVGDPSGTALPADPSGDLTGALEYRNSSGTWVTFDASGAALDASGTLVIRKAVNNDERYEGQEDFVLSVGYVAGATFDASGVSSLIDDGSGLLVDGSGNPSGGAPDDDRSLTVTGATYNEGSTHIFWTISGTAGQVAGLNSLLGDPSGTALPGDPSGDLTGALEYRNSVGNWVTFDASGAALDASGTLLIRKAVNNDEAYEGEEDFVLSVGYVAGATFDASGVSSLIDDGSGLLVDGSGNPSGGAPDDDRSLTVTAYGPFNEGSVELNPLAIFSIQATPGLELNLQLENTGSLLDKDATIAGFTEFQYSIDGGITWTTYSWNGEEGDRPTAPADGLILVRVNISSECDDPYEGPETFALTATYAGGGSRKATGIATIIDDGTGDVISKDPSGNPSFDGSGAPILNEEASKDDDRAELSIPDVNVNEASPYVVFQIYGTGGKTFKLALSDGAVDFAGEDDNDAFRGQQKAVVGQDYQNQLEVYNGTTWASYNDASGTFVPVDAALLLVRVPLINDVIYEAAHAFTLTATDANDKSISGRAIISDFGTGPIFNDSGSENSTADKDDDRTLKIDSPIVNEASDFVVFHVRGITGPVELALQFGNGTGFATLPNPNLEYWTGSAWALYTLGASLDPSGGFSTGTDLYVRVAIGEEQDDEREISERFTLEVSGAGGPSQGIATIRDDGTGDIPAFDASGNLLLDPSGNPVLDTIKIKDDDFDKDGITPTTEDALSTLVSSQGIPGAKPGDLNGDGEADALQSALATLAWQDVDSFNKGNDGTLTDIRPIISLMALEPSGSEVSSSLQLANVRVVDYNNVDEFPDVSGVVSIDGSGVRTVTLASGGTVTTTWDPIRFELAPQSGESGLSDADVTRAGTQVRMFIDMRASNLDASTFDSYIKYVSQDAIDASGDLFDLAGNQISSAGWYDFNQLTPGGDGARFVLDDGKITGIELTLTDNAFGDDDPTVDRILDPGSPVNALPGVPPLIPTEDGKGLKLDAEEEQSLWVDLSVILGSSSFQNSYNLVRRTYVGGAPVDTPIGAIGSTADSGFLGDSRVLLYGGQELRFVLKSNLAATVAAPDILISGQDNSFTVRMDDRGLVGETDYNDLVLRVRGLLDDPRPRNTQMARFQTSLEQAYLDLRWIEPNGTTLSVDVQTDSTARDVVRLVKVDTDASGNPLGTVGGFAPTAGRAFDRAVRARLLPFNHARTSAGISNLTLNLSGSDAGVYAPLIISAAGNIYTYGLKSSTDGRPHVKTLGASSFGFETRPAATSDWDFNDVVVTFTVPEDAGPRLDIVNRGRALKVVGGDSDDGLWLDLSALAGKSTWQNNLDLVKVDASGIQRSNVGSIGASANANGIASFGIYGNSMVYLKRDETLEFLENSNDNAVGNSPLLRITRVGERFVVAMDDRTGPRRRADGDYDDLIISVDSSPTPFDDGPSASPLPFTPDLYDLSRSQRTSSDGVLDLTGIDPNGMRLQLLVTSDSVNTNTLRFVKLDNDPITGLSVNSVSFSGSGGAAFRQAVRDNLTGPVVQAGGRTTQIVNWDVATPGFYAPVLQTPSSEVFTLGDTTASDGRQHLKLFGENHVGFEELLVTQGADWDYNDLTVLVTQITPL